MTDETRGDGLYLCKTGQPAQLLTTGTFAGAHTTPDGLWIVAAKAPGGWGDPNGIVRLDVKNKNEIPVAIPKTDTFDVLAYVPAHGKFLLHRERDPRVPGIEPEEGPAAPEYHLLDASTGASTVVTGTIRPWTHQQIRPLQPTQVKNEVWAALTARGDDKLAATAIGRYDTRGFAFREARGLPELGFSSEAMWVDEPANRIWVAYGGHVLSFELAAPPSPAGSSPPSSDR